MNPWNAPRGTYDTHKKESEIDPGAADNILIARPALFEGIEKIQPSGNGLAAFDLGCGAGSFSGALCRRGYRVDAVDTSPEMIKIANAHLGKKIAFYVAGRFRYIAYELRCAGLSPKRRIAKSQT